MSGSTASASGPRPATPRRAGCGSARIESAIVKAVGKSALPTKLLARRLCEELSLTRMKNVLANMVARGVLEVIRGEGYAVTPVGSLPKGVDRC